MDKVSKLLKKLTKKERQHLQAALDKLLSGDTVSLDIKKLKGVENIYRVRIGNLRIIFRKESGDIRVLDIGRRDTSTYRDF